MIPELTATQARVIACLVEKSITTPQYYPMSVNAVVTACNQKTARQPVMAMSEGDVGSTLNQLEELRLAKREDQLSRVPKWRHRFQHELLLKDAPMAVLVTLMLRGPLTLAELRSSAAALNGPADAAGVHAALEDLADRAQPLVAALARQPGQSSQRFTQMICPTAAEGLQTASFEAAPAAEAGVPSLAQRVTYLEQRLAELERQLGVEPAPPAAG